MIILFKCIIASVLGLILFTTIYILNSEKHWYKRWSKKYPTRKENIKYGIECITILFLEIVIIIFILNFIL